MPTNLPRSRVFTPPRIDTAICCALTLGALALYLRTLCPTIFTDDCGEIATAVTTGGVMHPPGYPLYTLLGEWLVRWVPCGEPAWRLGLLSSVAAACCAPLVYCLSRRVSAGRAWAAASALAFALSLCLWRQATKVETYSLNAFLVALILTCAARACETRRLRDLLLAAACCGLALANHLTSLCAIAGASWMLWNALRAQARPVAAALLAAACAALPLSLYAVIWLNAAGHPGGQAWGDPDTWRRFALHVSGARYKSYFGQLTAPALLRRDLLGVPATLWRNIGPLLVGIVPGFARGLRSRLPSARPLTIALLVALAAYAVETSVYGILNIFEYYTVPLMLVCIVSGSGCEAIALGIVRIARAARPCLPDRRWLGLAGAAACAAVLIVAPAAHWQACDRSHATFMRDLALNTLRTMPPDAVLITDGDNHIFPLWYAQDVLGARRDVAVVPHTLLSYLATADGRGEMGWQTLKLARQHPELIDANAVLAACAASPAYATSAQALWTVGERALELGRPLMMTSLPACDVDSSRGFPVLRGITPASTVVPYGLADEVMPLARCPKLIDTIRTNVALQARMRIDEAPDALTDDEPDGNFTNITYSWMLQRTGQLMAQAGNASGAVQQLRAAVELYPDAGAVRALDWTCSRPGLTQDALGDCSEINAGRRDTASAPISASQPRHLAAAPPRQGYSLRGLVQ